MKGNRTTSKMAQALMQPQAAADFLGVTVFALKKWRYEGHGPTFIRINSRRVRYRLSDLEAWLSKQEVRCA